MAVALLENEFWGSSVKKDIGSISCGEDTDTRLCVFSHMLNVT